MTVEIRLAQPEDAAGILSIYAPYCESTTVSFEIVAPSFAQMRERIERITANYPWLVAEAEGQLAGYVYASQFRERAAYRWTAEVAVYIAHDQKRRGIARALYTTLFSILRLQGYFKAIAGITLPNPASVGFHERLGFRPAGKFSGVGYKSGQWLDVGSWQRELQCECCDPSDPQPFRNMRDSAAVLNALADGRRLANS
jgi:phosphinothricin acetyltransferase